MSCTAQSLATDAQCLATALSDRQLLASIAYQLAVSAGTEPTPAVLLAQAKCLATLSERQLLASITYSQCVLAGG